MKLSEKKPRWLAAVSICLIVIILLINLFQAHWPLPFWIRIPVLIIIAADAVVESIYEIRQGQGYVMLLLYLLFFALGAFVLFGRNVLGWSFLPGQ